MRIVRTCDDARKRITLKPIGPVSLQDVMGLLQRQQEDGTSHYGVLYDLRAVAPLVSVSQVRELATEVARVGPSSPGPVAMVVVDAELYVRACSYAALVRPSGRRLQVFRDLADAEAWLDAETDASG